MQHNGNKPYTILSRRTWLLAGAATAAATLTGCPVLFVGGVAAGVVSAVDRRSTGAQVDDKTIELRAAQEISKALDNRGHINVNSYNRQVLLTGEVPSSQDKVTAEAVAGRIANVRSVVNALGVGPNSSMGTRSNDTYLTGKIKTALTNTEGVPAGQIKVTTERSVVYLMGIVTVHEAQLASAAASSVVGVQKVVRIFEIISEEELARMEAQNPPPDVGDPAETRP